MTTWQRKFVTRHCWSVSVMRHEWKRDTCDKYAENFNIHSHIKLEKSLNANWSERRVKTVTWHLTVTGFCDYRKRINYDISSFNGATARHTNSTETWLACERLCSLSTSAFHSRLKLGLSSLKNFFCSLRQPINKLHTGVERHSSNEGLYSLATIKPFVESKRVLCLSVCWAETCNSECLMILRVQFKSKTLTGAVFTQLGSQLDRQAIQSQLVTPGCFSNARGLVGGFRLAASSLCHANTSLILSLALFYSSSYMLQPQCSKHRYYCREKARKILWTWTKGALRPALDWARGDAHITSYALPAS